MRAASAPKRRPAALPAIELSGEEPTGADFASPFPEAPKPPRKPPTKPRGLRAAEEEPRGGYDEDAPLDEYGDAGEYTEGEGWRPKLLDLLSSGKPLGQGEAKSSRATLIKAIRKYGELADEAIPILSRSGRSVEEATPAGAIWGNLEEHDAAVLADALLDVGKRFVPVAQVVRGVVRTYSYLEVGAITVPRFLAMMRYYRNEGIGLSIKFLLGRREAGSDA